MAAMAVFESGFKEHMTKSEAIALVSRAIRSGIFNDLGSGSNVDVCIINKDKTEMLRNYEMPNERGLKARDYRFRRGTTAWTKEDVRNLLVKEDVKILPAGLDAGSAPPQTSGGEEMDTS